MTGAKEKQFSVTTSLFSDKEDAGCRDRLPTEGRSSVRRKGLCRAQLALTASFCSVSFRMKSSEYRIG